MIPNSGYVSPPTQPHERLKPCRFSCCKTPYGCARQRTCPCHEGEKRG